MDENIKKLIIKCDRVGCKWISELQYFYQHYENCDYEEISCKYSINGCIYKDYKMNMATHQTNCFYEKINCKGCKEEILKSELVCHESKCDYLGKIIFHYSIL
jgi:hypothetical protein